MFGKRSSKNANEKFVMSMGVKAGNLKGRGSKPPTPPVTKVATKGSALPSPYSMKRGVKVNQNKPQSLGKSGTFKTTGKV